VLGGVAIPAAVHLHGHSDGDAIAHAVTDAVLGAAALGDIGSMFPNSDPDNAGRDSIEMLILAVALVEREGWRVGQLDVVVITETPKIAPHRPAMCDRIAGAVGCEAKDVSIKGKTNEGMGFIGRGEGLACLATATLYRA
jgi:2-C-methyl-D-erythritol 2,4-cyclodiphosphate synthase